MYWENYGLFAQGFFDGIGFNQNARYSFTILQKNNPNWRIDPFTGQTLISTPVINLLCGSNPATLRYLSDEIIGVKGSELVLNLINKDNQLPLTTFYSDEEDTFKIVFKVTYEEGGNDVTKTLFIGYLIQEDSNEILSDITHEIQLSFTDNLGGLKNIDYEFATKCSPTSAANLRNIQANCAGFTEETTFFSGTPIGTVRLASRVDLYNNQTLGNPQVGDYIFLNDSPIGDVPATIIDISSNLGITSLWVREKLISYPLTSSVKISYITGSSLVNKIKLKDALRICLHATNLNLDIKYAGSISALTETQQSTEDFWDTIYVDPRSFMQSESTWISCYDVLDRICRKFNISFYQQDGAWYMVRLHELPYYNNVVPGYNYNGYFESQSTGNITSQISFGNEQDIEAGITQTILRPCNFVSEYFEYKNPKNLLYNNALSITGQKRLSQSNNPIAGLGTWRYDAIGFSQYPSITQFQYKPYIDKIITMGDASLTEEDRYLVIRYESGVINQQDEVAVIYSDPIEINKGDRIKLSWAWRHQYETDTQAAEMRVILFYGNNPSDNYILTNSFVTGSEQYEWTNGVFSAISKEISHLTWNDFTIESAPVPVSGQIRIFFGNRYYVGSINTNRERWYKNLTLEIINQTQAKKEIKAELHKSFVNQISKSNINSEAYFGDTLKNTVAGTLIFGTSTTNLIRRRTVKWMDPFSLAQFKLNELSTREMMNWRFKPRAKLECRILGIIRADDSRFKMYNALLFLIGNNTFFIFGKAEFNFREDTINCTLYELYKTGDYQGTGTYRSNVNYEFKYIY